MSRINDQSRHNQSSSPRGILAIIPGMQGTPAFTAEEVKLYYQSHDFSAGPAVSGTPPTIESIKFMTSREAEVLKGSTVGLPDNAMVCYVELRGPFYSKYISVPQGQELPTTLERGFAIFDAQTGNLLGWGTD